MQLEQEPQPFKQKAVTNIKTAYRTVSKFYKNNIDHNRLMKILVVSGLFIFFYWACNQELNKEQPLDNSHNDLLAYNYAIEAVKENLRAPTTATFAQLRERKDHVKYLGSGKYEITSYVDSQNGFGAMIRARFKTTVTFKDGYIYYGDVIFL